MADSPHNLAQLLDRLEETLVATIPDTIRQMDVKQKAYCVFVVFHDTTVYEDFRPHLVVAPERSRSKLFETEPHAAENVWNRTALDVYEMSPGGVTDAPTRPAHSPLQAELFNVLTKGSSIKWTIGGNCKLLPIPRRYSDRDVRTAG